MPEHSGLARRVRAPRIVSAEQLHAADVRRDVLSCGVPLACDEATRLALLGAHDPTATPYFVLEELFSQVTFAPASHLLDVGCGKGRVLAYVSEELPGVRATGIELDPELARYAQEWTRGRVNLEVRCASVLDEPLGGYTHIYLFNPFDTAVLVQFIEKLEREAAGPVTVMHMSDNGEQYSYMGRQGWRALTQGSIQDYRSQTGVAVRIYGCPQTYTIWEYAPQGR